MIAFGFDRDVTVYRPSTTSDSSSSSGNSSSAYDSAEDVNLLTANQWHRGAATNMLRPPEYARSQNMVVMSYAPYQQNSSSTSHGSGLDASSSSSKETAAGGVLYQFGGGTPSITRKLHTPISQCNESYRQFSSVMCCIGPGGVRTDTHWFTCDLTMVDHWMRTRGSSITSNSSSISGAAAATTALASSWLLRHATPVTGAVIPSSPIGHAAAPPAPAVAQDDTLTAASPIPSSSAASAAAVGLGGGSRLIAAGITTTIAASSSDLLLLPAAAPPAVAPAAAVAATIVHPALATTRAAQIARLIQGRPLRPPNHDDPLPFPTGPDGVQLGSEWRRQPQLPLVALPHACGVMRSYAL